ncbi:SUKH-3 domain-containing protein [Streptomyces olivaceus]|uniref:SUKH-3 domain-containing protein n=1 Tax=Streptomyces olivaceus TaxID=47716 RepID=UPI001CCEED12|nr:SUKH-3 domain-containing protein [Streptomyces olivaceus]MBZ6303872.1 SUKH-3 domain-containing protein [Streptomyces olivaceus]MBZ6317269.1 SUKH-3 domain-containing protein [Streptomyces olivaceus]
MTSSDVPAEWSPLTYRVLRSAGWYSGRSVPLDRYESRLREFSGLGMHDAARCFLGEFAGLSTADWTPGPLMPQSPFRLVPCDADTPREAGVEIREVVLRMSESAGAPLYPVGCVDEATSWLGMAADGSVFVGDGSAQLLARGAYEALEVLTVERRTDAPLPFVLVGDHLELPPGFGATRGPDGVPRWSPETERVLRLAGWQPGRAVSTESWERTLQEADKGYAMHEAARRFLSEFGGLEVRERGPGVNAARSPFRLDPTSATDDFEIIEYLGEEADARLYPVGHLPRGSVYLTVADDGAVYVGMDEVELLADAADAALDKLVRGIR